ncbi:MAG: fluoride efflux transporter CrcB [Anaerolineae bacterium]|nr:fluoride efflux transporter CrcB [Anaerolineae bacterium]
MDQVTAISIGAVLGANARYWLGVWVDSRFATGFPLGTLVVNCTGSLVLGFLLILTTQRIALSPRWRLLLAVGFLGSYTTFSSFSVETLALLDEGSWLLALANVLLSVGFGLVGAWLGARLAAGI